MPPARLHLQARVGGPQHLRHPVAGRVQRGAPRLGDQVLGHRLAEPGRQLVAGARCASGSRPSTPGRSPAGRRRRAARRRSRTTESDRDRWRPSPPRSYVTNGIGFSSERNGVPVSIRRRTAGSNAALTPSPHDRGVAGVVDLVEDHQRPAGHRAPAVHLRRHAHLRVGDDGAVEVGRRSARRRCGTSGRAGCRPAPRPVAHCALRCSVGATTVTASTVPSASSSAAIRRANVVLPAPGRGDRQEVLAAPAQVLHERLALPGPQRRELSSEVRTRPATSPLRPPRATKTPPRPARREGGRQSNRAGPARHRATRRITQRRWTAFVVRGPCDRRRRESLRIARRPAQSCADIGSAPARSCPSTTPARLTTAPSSEATA